MSTATTPAPRKSLTYIHDTTEFYPHQISGVRRGAKLSSFILADEMGLGKTLQALTVAAIDFEQGWAGRILAVTPATLKGNWAEEVEKHTDFSAIVLDGGPKRRRKVLADLAGRDDWHVLIVNYEQVKPHLETLNSLNFDIVLYDEAHYIKGHKSQRTKACHSLHGKRHILITGSPILNHVDDLWSLLYRVDPGRFPNYWRFLNRYAVFGGYKDKQIVGVKNESELNAILNEYMIRRHKEEVLDLPEKQRIKVSVDLSPLQKRLYKELNEELLLSVPDEPAPVEIENALTKFLRLKQVCGTPATFGHEDESFKLDRVVEDVDELCENGHKVVVWTQFRAVIAALERRFGDLPYPVTVLHGDVPRRERVPRVAQWERTEGPAILVSMLQVGGTGLNMAAARHVLFVDKLFNPKLNEQAEDRSHRIGSDLSQPVQIREYVARNTIEQRIETILRRKKKVFDAVVDQAEFKRKLIEALKEEDDV